MFQQPGVGRGNQEQATGVDPLVYRLKEQCRVVEAVDQVGGQDQVITGKYRLEIAGVALIELDLFRHRIEPQFRQRPLLVGHQLAFIDQRVAQPALLGQTNAESDEAGGEIDTGDLPEMPRQLEARPPGGATEIERPGGRFVAHRGDGQLRQRTREIRYVEIFVAIVEFGVFRNHPFGFVVRGRNGHRRGGNNVAEPGMLEEVATEGIARLGQGLVAAGNPRTALDQVVTIIEGRRREVVVDRVNLEAVERIGRRFSPLPDIANHVKQRTLSKLGDRARRGVMIELEIGPPGRKMACAGKRAQRLPFIFRRQANRLSADPRLPLAERLGLVIIGFHRPVPRHRHLFQHQAQTPLRAIPHPESRMLRLGKCLPAGAFFLPQRIVLIAAGLDEVQKLPVGDEIAASLESSNAGCMDTELVVPAVDGIARRPAKTHVGRRNGDQRIRRRFRGFTARRPGRMRLDVLERVLADQHRRGFQVDSFVLDAHQDDPPRVAPGDREGQRLAADQLLNRRSNRLAIGPDLVHTRPLVTALVEIIPTHFVDTDGKHRFETRVDALLDPAGQQQLVDEESRRMAEVEDQRMAQADRLPEIRLIAGQHLEQLFIAIKGGMKIVEDLRAFLFDIGTGQHG